MGGKASEVSAASIIRVENGSTMFLENAGSYTPNSMLSHPR
jgi:hypothetical protein